MLIPRRLFLLLFAATLVLSSCTTNFYIVRHAEKADDGTNNPDLTMEGQTRAVALKDTLLDKGIDTIFVSTYARTQQTAAPTATAYGETSVIEPSTQQLITTLRGISGKDVLVVGHSNTVPQIIDGLMEAPQGIAIDEDDFDNLFRIKISRSIFSNTPKRTLTQGTYGAASP